MIPDDISRELGECAVLNCQQCGVAIAAAPSGDAYCCRCRYGELHETPREDEPDLIEKMNRNHAQFRSGNPFWEGQ